MSKVNWEEVREAVVAVSSGLVISFGLGLTLSLLIYGTHDHKLAREFARCLFGLVIVALAIAIITLAIHFVCQVLKDKKQKYAKTKLINEEDVVV